MRSIASSLPDLAAHADQLTEGAAILEGFREAFENLEDRERRPLSAALESAKSALREGLADLDDRLRNAAGQSLRRQPLSPLTRGGTIVADTGDDNDDSAAGG